MIQGRIIDFFETRERRQAAESSLDTRQALVAPEGRQLFRERLEIHP